MSEENTTKTYFEKFKEDYLITDENNTIELKTVNPHNNVLVTKPFKIFTEDKKGNLDILVYTIDGETIQYTNPNATPNTPNPDNNRDKLYKVKRLAVPRIYKDKKGNEKLLRYEFPSKKEADHKPFFPPKLVEKYATGEHIETLIFTEGYKKAFYGSLFGFDIIGLGSTTLYRENATGMIYGDILRLILKCKPKNIIILFDGDVLDISLTALEKGEDIRKRPHGFFTSTLNIKELLKDYTANGIDLYFAHVKSENVNKAKGLDDALMEMRGKEIEMLEDLTSFSRPGQYFWKNNISNNANKLHEHFHTFNVDNFYLYHQTLIGDKSFVFNGSTYKYNDADGRCDMQIPAEVFDYFRVGDNYYKFIKIPNKYGDLEKTFTGRKKGTIVDDLGRVHVCKIPKYEAFCNVPSHSDFQQIVHSCFNTYYPFEWDAEEGDCQHSLDYIRHIFGEQYELGLDYVQLLYQKPNQVLPILCLVSSENNTGKSTFLKWLKAIFTQNCTVIGNDQLIDQFNGSYATKLIVGCEETFIDKKPVIEKLKNLSTGDKIQLRKMQSDPVEIDFFGKFILLTNNERSFIYASKDDIRFWVRKIYKPKTDNPNILADCLIPEIPAFLYYLNKRAMHTKQESRMWFHESLIKTDALRRLVESNKPRLEREIEDKIKQLFIETGLPTLHYPLDYIRDNFITVRKIEDSYLREVLEMMKVERYKNSNGKFDSTSVKIYFLDAEYTVASRILRCRPYVFNRESFITESDLEQYEIKNSGTKSTEQQEVAQLVDDQIF